METPTMAKWSGSSFPLARLYSAGINLRLVKSPPAPKITITHAGPGEPIVSCVKFPELVELIHTPSHKLFTRAPAGLPAAILISQPRDQDQDGREGRGGRVR